ncbi:MAG: FecR family protein [Ignavibacteria bacterium]|jgi:hypothetical protein|nr:FecR family protein [Ignavibacteria bacterium]
MNSIIKLAVLFLILPVLLFAAENPGSNVSKSENPVAVVMKVVKEVSTKKEGTDWATAKIGQTLKTGDEVKTGDKSLALIKFTDNSLIRVRENSSLKIFADKKDKTISKNTHIDKGRVGFEVAKQENEEFKFTTPTMVASIRGTEGFFDVFPDGASLLVVARGLIEVLGTLGNKDGGNVGAGQYVMYNNNGDMTLGDATEGMMKDQQGTRSTNLKKIRIQTSQGELVIEYYAE